MPRFVLLFHERPASAEVASHWDLMLEHEGALLTWRLQTLPDAWQSTMRPEVQPATIPVAAERLPNHRIEYLDYEGPISGDRGHVSRWDCGDYSVLNQSTETLQVRLAGQRARGAVTLPNAPNAPPQPQTE